METINEALQMICFILLFLLLFKDMSGKDELRRIREELERIANELKRRGAEMKEYIERELLLIGVDGCISSLHAQAKGEPIQESAIKLVEVTRDYIASFTAADVAPVRHGRWEPGNPICPVCGENKFKDLDADVWADWQPKFCPNCGARMGKEDGHD